MIIQTVFIKISTELFPAPLFYCIKTPLHCNVYIFRYWCKFPTKGLCPIASILLVHPFVHPSIYWCICLSNCLPVHHSNLESTHRLVVVSICKFINSIHPWYGSTQSHKPQITQIKSNKIPPKKHTSSNISLL